MSNPTYDVYGDWGGVGWFDELPHKITADSPEEALAKYEASENFGRGVYHAAVVNEGDDPNLLYTNSLVFKQYP